MLVSAQSAACRTSRTHFPFSSALLPPPKRLTQLFEEGGAGVGGGGGGGGGGGRNAVLCGSIGIIAVVSGSCTQLAWIREIQIIQSPFVPCCVAERLREQVFTQSNQSK